MLKTGRANRGTIETTPPRAQPLEGKAPPGEWLGVGWGMDSERAYMTDESIDRTRYQSDCLFLLVGTNPLPNFLAAKLLLKQDGRLILVHSSLTKSVAERMTRYWTEIEKQKQPTHLCVVEADGADIRRKIDLALREINKGQAGLHYTGGTKTMSVYACRTMLDYQEDNHRPVTLSYLDARSNRMYIEHGGDQPFVTDVMLYAAQPSLQTIVSLHAFKLASPIIMEAMLPELSTSLVAAHQSPEAATDWRKWCDGVLRQETRTKKASEWDKENWLAQVVLPLPADETLRTVADKICEVFGLPDGLLPLGEARQRTNFQKVKHLCEWLDGKWLEHYVYQIVQRIKEEEPDSRLHDIGMGIHPQIEQDGPQYDVDIGVMQGYRLYAISCTTDADPGMCKLKLFEAYLRARNMAGDEAHVGLVCMADHPENLERQVSRSWDVEGKVRVFGRPHLSELTDHLADWFISAGSL